MNLSEVNWDISASGTWPLPIKIIAIVLISAVVAGAGVYFDTNDMLTTLDADKKKEQDLRQSFEIKHKKAVNLPEYREQLEQIEASLSEMIRQMPTKAEVASLLVDITQTGLASGLQFLLFKPENEIIKDFYIELPISIKVIGQYHELGLFVSGLASLPRIVTVHDVEITPTGNETDLLMKAQIRTYNEGTGLVKPKKKKRRGRRR
jgi:type IV pilus assembly protein PilO